MGSGQRGWCHGLCRGLLQNASAFQPLNLIWKKSLCRFKDPDVRRAPWIPGVALNPMTIVLIREWRGEATDTGEEAT